MTDQEQTLISDLAERIRSTPPPAIDRDADNLIRRTIGARPDALYVLTQIVIMQQAALNQAQNQIEEMQQSQRPAGGGSFLQSGYAQPQYQQTYAPPPPPPQYYAPQQSGFSGFLHNAAQTAAGVFAGEMAFDALSSLFGHHGGGGGGSFLEGGGGGNYLDDSGSGESRFSEAADQNQDISSDIEDDRDSSGGDDFSGDDSN